MQLAYNNKRDKLDTSVSYLIPAAITGSGLGANQVSSATTTSNYSMTHPKQYGVVNLRIGDLVAIIDADNSSGRIYRSGTVSVGVVVHTKCVSTEHGPGLNTLMTSDD